MDKSTRTAIEKATQRARRLLEADFAEQLEGIYDVLPSGQVAASGGPHLFLGNICSVRRSSPRSSTSGRPA